MSSARSARTSSASTASIPRYAYVGHYVGLSVHDVGDWNAPFEAGMVMAIEPIIDIPEQQLHIRVEDTILVTPTGAEVLTSAVPKEVGRAARPHQAGAIELIRRTFRSA